MSSSSFPIRDREGDAPDGGLYFIVEGRVDVLVGGGDGAPTSPGGVRAPTSPGSGAQARPHYGHTRYTRHNAEMRCPHAHLYQSASELFKIRSRNVSLTADQPRKRGHATPRPLEDAIVVLVASPKLPVW